MNTTYFLNLVAGNLYGTKKSPAIPTKFYLGLSKSTPNVSGGNVTEPTGGAYTRVELTGLSAPSNGEVSNSAQINFPESTANWGTVTHFVVYDALSGGNLLCFGALPAQRTVESDTVMSIKSGYLKLSVKNAS